MKKYYFPPQITQIALFSESHLLEGSLRLKVRGIKRNV